jgi:threonine synthase
MAMTCSGCGWSVPAGELRPFRCPNSGSDDVDHVLVRHIDDGTIDDDPDPFIRYRRRMHIWQGADDRQYVDVVRRLEDRIEKVDGRRFAMTPFARGGNVWVKDETNNVAGSHKARHLMGVLIWLELHDIDAPLAIASCGNAAYAASILARATNRRLDVYVPAGANTDRIEANVIRCERRSGERGDPAYLRFREAVARGALPFTCQGNENGLVIEGGSTLGWEMREQNQDIERIFIQTGGGALASAVIAAYDDRLPRIHAVQTHASPLARAWELVQSRGLGYAIHHRSEFMWPWETVPESVAEGILDDETYDWVAVIRGMLVSGGWPVIVSEEQLIEANRIAGPGVSATGSAGLAGALALPGDEVTAVLFTG